MMQTYTVKTEVHGHSTLNQQHTLGVQAHFQDIVCEAHKTSSVTVYWRTWHPISFRGSRMYIEKHQFY